MDKSKFIFVSNCIEIFLPISLAIATLVINNGGGYGFAIFFFVASALSLFNVLWFVIKHKIVVLNIIFTILSMLLFIPVIFFEMGPIQSFGVPQILAIVSDVGSLISIVLLTIVLIFEIKLFRNN